MSFCFLKLISARNYNSFFKKLARDAHLPSKLLFQNATFLEKQENALIRHLPSLLLNTYLQVFCYRNNVQNQYIRSKSASKWIYKTFTTLESNERTPQKKQSSFFKHLRVEKNATGMRI